MRFDCENRIALKIDFKPLSNSALYAEQEGVHGVLLAKSTLLVVILAEFSMIPPSTNRPGLADRRESRLCQAVWAWVFADTEGKE